MKHTDKFILKLWKKFGDTPITDDDLIDEDFYIWKKGTDRIEVIWRWFDNNYSTGLKGLMHTRGIGITYDVIRSK